MVEPPDTQPGLNWSEPPQAAQDELSLAQGAVACTTNPAFGGNLLGRAPTVHTVMTSRTSPAAGLVVTRPWPSSSSAWWVVSCPSSRPCSSAVVAERDGSRCGGPLSWIPRSEPILAAARVARSMADNCIPKIPATLPGLAALDVLVRDDQPVLMTEVFSLAQVAETCERYLARPSAASGNTPVFIMAPITGIFGDHLKKVAGREGHRYRTEAVTWAGIVVRGPRGQAARRPARLSGAVCSMAVPEPGRVHRSGGRAACRDHQLVDLRGGARSGSRIIARRGNGTSSCSGSRSSCRPRSTTSAGRSTSMP